ncbi:O-antigen ligase family protein [Halodesulfovibrio sp.]|uniref:O-antigen ligase family protein n=1 Tax=Halodesulfovibrio sp. TaxID=1912772 RepID=UPI0025F8E6B8|nr:O-antigen ligase family protein [Halodesulfovibrio sp.]MCT4627060.1 O-antigen ligase family protein [Halodesulfovibrio sp.]
MAYKEIVLTKWNSITQAQIHTALVYLFCFYMLFFSFGRIFIQIGQIGSILLLAAYYAKGFRNTNLHNFGGKKFFLIFFAYLALNILLSEWPAQSIRAISSNWWKAFLIPFIAMELVTSEKDLQKLIVAFSGAAFLQGLDGIWQYFTGFDLIHHTAIYYDRLTGSMKTPRVGNYMAIILPAACGILYFTKQQGYKWGKSICATLLIPAVFLWIFSLTRSGYAGACLASFTLWAFVWPPFRWYKLALPAAAASALLVLGPSRISLERLMQDSRWEIWSFALKIFDHFPIFGAGLKTYAPARDMLGLKQIKTHAGIPHPHNIYLQFLSDGGVIGFAVCMLFLFGLLYYAFKAIRPNVVQEMQSRSSSYYWRYTALFWGGYLAYLGTGISAHDFFRTWWLTIGMAMLGITLGACTYGVNTPKSQTSI